MTQLARAGLPENNSGTQDRQLRSVFVVKEKWHFPLKEKQPRAERSSCQELRLSDVAG